MRLRKWLNRDVLAIGEAMLEFAPVGEGLFRRGFAGDTLNTCWHLAQILGGQAQVGYCTRVGVDPFSDELTGFIAESGIDVRHISRDPARSIGLYVISLAGAERSFSYWRETSAARHLADDLSLLEAAVRNCGLIHVSGITLAIVGRTGRQNLMTALARARASGSVVSFDPNLRRRLWLDDLEMRQAMREMLALTDIALPSFDDEAQLWGDANPDATVSRLSDMGVDEIAVKNGAGDIVYSYGAVRDRIATPDILEVRDTTGAGDSFNAGYLAARLVGASPGDSCRLGQSLAGEVIGHFGALAPQQILSTFQSSIERLAMHRQ